MSIEIDSARISAGIGSMSKNYPDDDKQRGCGYWAAFVGALRNQFSLLHKEVKDVTNKLNAALKANQDLSDELKKVTKGANIMVLENLGRKAKLDSGEVSTEIRRLAG
jgi:hypothetical protein